MKYAVGTIWMSNEIGGRLWDEGVKIRTSLEGGSHDFAGIQVCAPLFLGQTRLTDYHSSMKPTRILLLSLALVTPVA